jgi:hypothetical protein
MGVAQGKKVDPSAVAAQAIEAKPSCGQISHREASWLACWTASSGADVAEIGAHAQEAGQSGRKKRSCSVEKGVPSAARQTGARRFRKAFGGERYCRHEEFRGPRLFPVTLDTAKCPGVAPFDVRGRTGQPLGPKLS